VEGGKKTKNCNQKQFSPPLSGGGHRETALNIIYINCIGCEKQLFRLQKQMIINFPGERFKTYLQKYADSFRTAFLFLPEKQ
jgi:hypothetical protein